MGLTFEDIGVEDPADEEQRLRGRKLLAHHMGKKNRGRKHLERKRPFSKLSEQERRAARKLKRKSTKDDRRSNHQLLENVVGKALPSDAVGLLRSFSSSFSRFKVRAHRRKRLRAVLPAYALWWELRHAPDPVLVAERLKQLVKQRLPNNEKDFLPWLLQFTLDYTDIDDDGKKILDSKALSRDAQAIRWLMLRGIPPWEVMDKQKGHGGGLNRWSRLMAAHNKKHRGAAAESDESETDQNEEANGSGVADGSDVDSHGDTDGADVEGAVQNTGSSNSEDEFLRALSNNAGVEFGDYLIVALCPGRDHRLALKNVLKLEFNGPGLRRRLLVQQLLQSLAGKAEKSQIKVTGY